MDCIELGRMKGKPGTYCGTGGALQSAHFPCTDFALVVANATGGLTRRNDWNIQTQTEAGGGRCRSGY